MAWHCLRSPHDYRQASLRIVASEVPSITVYERAAIFCSFSVPQPTLHDPTTQVQHQAKQPRNYWCPEPSHGGQLSTSTKFEPSPDTATPIKSADPTSSNPPGEAAISLPGRDCLVCYGGEGGDRVPDLRHGGEQRDIPERLREGGRGLRGVRTLPYRHVGHSAVHSCRADLCRVAG